MGWVTLDERGSGGPDWQHDPWDDPDVTDALVVERSRRASWYVRWAVYSIFAILTVGVLVAGSLGWWYLNEINPAGDPGIAVNFTVNPGEIAARHGFDAAIFDDVAERLAPAVIAGIAEVSGSRVSVPPCICSWKPIRNGPRAIAPGR